MINVLSYVFFTVLAISSLCVVLFQNTFFALLFLILSFLLTAIILLNGCALFMPMEETTSQGSSARQLGLGQERQPQYQENHNDHEAHRSIIPSCHADVSICRDYLSDMEVSVTRSKVTQSLHAWPGCAGAATVAGIRQGRRSG